MKKLHFFILSFSLIAVGLGFFFYKAFWLKFPLAPNTTVGIWDVETRVSFDAKKDKPVKVSLFTPSESKSFTIISEHFVSGKYGLTPLKKGPNRQANWSVRKTKGKQELYYRAVVHKLAEKKKSNIRSKPPNLTSPTFKEPRLSAARNVLDKVYAQSSDIDTMVGSLLKCLNQPETDENVALLLGNKKKSLLKKIEVAVQILALTKIPARTVHGISLKESALNAHFVHWLEVYHGKQWRVYNPVAASPEIPEDFLTWWRGPDPLYKVAGGVNTKINVAVSLNKEEAILGAVQRVKVVSPRFLEFSLFSLPIQTQMVYRILLLIPLGALLVVFSRNIIGVKTFGTFMPVLIALAFRETELLWGTLLFSGVIALGLGFRFYLENLKLLVVPRLASVLIMVIIIMAVINILTYKLELGLGLSVSLFPMVILTMMIERMSIVWEERGAGEAMKQGIGSLFVSALAYGIMTNNLIEHLMFIFPELLLVLLACAILMGRYSGYRLFEIIRFKELSGEKT